jgi:phage-related minor tail protein
LKGLLHQLSNCHLRRRFHRNPFHAYQICHPLDDAAGGFSAADFANLAASHIDSAKGNVFSGSPSLHQYANTIQTTPVTFSFDKLHKFARGGVFAEAGPEAVMPLSRDSAGRLGVKAQGGGGRTYNITVNVNGNNNAQDVRRAAGQGAREAASFISAAHRYV